MLNSISTKPYLSLRVVSCSRWVEMTEGLRFHVGLASAACAPTEFRMLNGVLSALTTHFLLDVDANCLMTHSY
jgi:hypothetical protein